MFQFRLPSAPRAFVLVCAVIALGALGCRSVNGPCPVVTLTVTWTGRSVGANSVSLATNRT